MIQRETRNRAIILVQDVRQDAVALARLLMGPEIAADINLVEVERAYDALMRTMENLRKTLSEAFE